MKKSTPVEYKGECCQHWATRIRPNGIDMSLRLSGSLKYVPSGLITRCRGSCKFSIHLKRNWNKMRHILRSYDVFMYLYVSMTRIHCNQIAVTNAASP